MRKLFCWQDGVQLRTANRVQDVLNQHFHDRVLNNQFPACFRYGWSLPVYSSNLNPCDFFLWVLLKNTVYRNNPHATHDLKQDTSAAVISTNEHALAGVMLHYQRQLQFCMLMVYIPQIFSLNFHSLETAVFSDTKHNDVYHIIW
jgi:hypothetical protein